MRFRLFEMRRQPFLLVQIKKGGNDLFCHQVARRAQHDKDGGNGLFPFVHNCFAIIPGISDLDLFLVPRTLPPALDTTILSPEQAASRSARFRRLFFARLTSPACCRVIDFSDTAPILFPRPQIATAIGVLPARHRQRIDPPQHLAKQLPVQMWRGGLGSA
jgi:hypothetical protein